ncbi:MAG: PIN domain-containing protein [Verrucomicrobiales bacterium]|nr:PIN domain-containing protein [Verrucomicrobiales bacterium]
MIAVDTDILVYCHRMDSPHHIKALVAVERLVKRDEPWAIPWPCMIEFIDTVSRNRPYNPPSSIEQCFKAFDKWRKSSSLQFIGEGPGYYEKFRKLAASQNPVGDEIEDIRIAAICIHHGVDEFWSADRDFSSFSSIRCKDPLIIPNR